MVRQKIILVGNYPPPYGGISAHVERLRSMLSMCYDVSVIDLYNGFHPRDEPGIHRCGPSPFKSLIKAMTHLHRSQPQAVHFHVTFLKSFEYVGPLLLRALPKQCRTLMTIHGGKFVRFFGNLMPLRR